MSHMYAKTLSVALLSVGIASLGACASPTTTESVVGEDEFTSSAALNAHKEQVGSVTALGKCRRDGACAKRANDALLTARGDADLEALVAAYREAVGASLDAHVEDNAAKEYLTEGSGLALMLQTYLRKKTRPAAKCSPKQGETKEKCVERVFCDGDSKCAASKEAIGALCEAIAGGKSAECVSSTQRGLLPRSLGEETDIAINGAVQP